MHGSWNGGGVVVVVWVGVAVVVVVGVDDGVVSPGSSLTIVRGTQV
jgi:hypothetical protein